MAAAPIESNLVDGCLVLNDFPTPPRHPDDR